MSTNSLKPNIIKTLPNMVGGMLDGMLVHDNKPIAKFDLSDEYHLEPVEHASSVYTITDTKHGKGTAGGLKTPWQAVSSKGLRPIVIKGLEDFSGRIYLEHGTKMIVFPGYPNTNFEYNDFAGLVHRKPGYADNERNSGVMPAVLHAVNKLANEIPDNNTYSVDSIESSQGSVTGIPFNKAHNTVLLRSKLNKDGKTISGENLREYLKKMATSFSSRIAAMEADGRYDTMMLELRPVLDKWFPGEDRHRIFDHGSDLKAFVDSQLSDSTHDIFRSRSATRSSISTKRIDTSKSLPADRVSELATAILPRVQARISSAVSRIVPNRMYDISGVLVDMPSVFGMSASPGIVNKIHDMANESRTRGLIRGEDLSDAMSTYGRSVLSWLRGAASGKVTRNDQTLAWHMLQALSPGLQPGAMLSSDAEAVAGTIDDSAAFRGVPGGAASQSVPLSAQIEKFVPGLEEAYALLLRDVRRHKKYLVDQILSNYDGGYSNVLGLPLTKYVEDAVLAKADNMGSISGEDLADIMKELSMSPEIESMREWASQDDAALPREAKKEFERALHHWYPDVKGEDLSLVDFEKSLRGHTHELAHRFLPDTRDTSGISNSMLAAGLGKLLAEGSVSSLAQFHKYAMRYRETRAVANAILGADSSIILKDPHLLEALSEKDTLAWANAPDRIPLLHKNPILMLNMPDDPVTFLLGRHKELVVPYLVSYLKNEDYRNIAGKIGKSPLSVFVRAYAAKNAKEIVHLLNVEHESSGITKEDKDLVLSYLQELRVLRDAMGEK